MILEQLSAPFVQVGQRQGRYAAARDGLTESAGDAREIAGRLG
jgi:hypothetical protein